MHSYSYIHSVIVSQSARSETYMRAMRKKKALVAAADLDFQITHTPGILSLCIRVPTAYVLYNVLQISFHVNGDVPASS